MTAVLPPILVYKKNKLWCNVFRHKQIIEISVKCTEKCKIWGYAHIIILKQL